MRISSDTLLRSARNHGWMNGGGDLGDPAALDRFINRFKQFREDEGRTDPFEIHAMSRQHYADLTKIQRPPTNWDIARIGLVLLSRSRWALIGGRTFTRCWPRSPSRSSPPGQG